MLDLLAPGISFFFACASLHNDDGNGVEHGLQMGDGRFAESMDMLRSRWRLLCSRIALRRSQFIMATHIVLYLIVMKV